MKKILICLFLISSFSVFSQDKSEKKKMYYLDLNGGYGIRLGKNGGEDYFERQYIENLKKGFAYGGNFYVRLGKNSNFFLGLNYNHFDKKSSINVYEFTATNEKVGEYSDNTSISYFGLSGMFSKSTNWIKGEYNFEIGLGYLSYYDKVISLDDQYELKGGNLGGLASVGYYFKVTEWLYLGPKANVLYGKLKKVTISADGQKETVDLDEFSEGLRSIHEDLTRVDFSGVARFKF